MSSNFSGFGGHIYGIAPLKVHIELLSRRRPDAAGRAKAGKQRRAKSQREENVPQISAKPVRGGNVVASTHKLIVELVQARLKPRKQDRTTHHQALTPDIARVNVAGVMPENSSRCKSGASAQSRMHVATSVEEPEPWQNHSLPGLRAHRRR